MAEVRHSNAKKTAEKHEEARNLYSGAGGMREGKGASGIVVIGMVAGAYIGPIMKRSPACLMREFR